MTIEEARKILDDNDEYMDIEVSSTSTPSLASLDGWFTSEELKAIITFLESGEVYDSFKRKGNK